MNEQETLESIEKALDVVEDRLDAVVPEVVQTVRVVKNNPVLLAGVAVVSLAVGAVAGYYISKKRLEPKYEELARVEIEEAKQFYNTLHKREEYSTPESTVEALVPEEAVRAAEAIRSYQGEEETPEAQAAAVVVVNNIFETNKPDLDFDYEEEIKRRSPDRPYIITEDEFMANEKEYEQSQLTYFEGDDVLSDDRDDVVADSDGTVGDDNLTRFGHGSKNNNILFVRNEALELEFEIMRSTGKYAAEVLGFIEHSDDYHRKSRKTRWGDDE